jgi:GNAT superfamily N-acetyltransferase
MNVTYRKAGIEDKNSVIELFIQLVILEASRNPTRLPEPKPEYGEQYFNKIYSYIQKGTGEIWVAEIEGNIVACAAGYIKEQFNEDLLEFKQMQIGYISDLYVRDEYRNMGIGKTLVQYIEDFFKNKGCTYFELSVTAKNDGGHKFYTELGYFDYRNEMLKQTKNF